MRRDSEGPNILPGFKQPHEAPQVAQRVKNLPGMQETRVQSLDWEDPLEEGMAIHSNILAWTIPWTAGPGRLQSMGLQRVGHNFSTKHHHQCLGQIHNSVENKLGK